MWQKLFMTMFIVLSFVSVSIAKDVTIGLEWDANVETNLAGYGAYVGDAAGGPYVAFADILKGTQEVWWTYDAVLGTSVIKYFVVDAYNDEGLRSGYSNEVFWVYDMLPICTATAFAATLAGDDVTFTWTQLDIERVKEWKLYVKEEAAEFAELALIEYTGQAGPQYSATETMSVPEDTKKTFIFSLVTFTENGVFSENSTEVSITINKIKPVPVYNLRIKVKVD